MRVPILEVTQLRIDLTIRGRPFTVVEDMSFSLQKKETLGIVGESGCGKSMTSFAILRLIAPEVGTTAAGSSIRLQGRELLDLPEKEMRKVRGAQIALILQDSLSVLNPVATIEKQMVETIRAHRRVSRREAAAASVAMLEKVGIPSPAVRIKEYPHQLSGGMKQRIGIAIALLCQPQVLIADEPTTALDLTIQAQILELMKELREQSDTGIILITHDLGVIAEMADNVLVMYAGRVMEYAATTRIFQGPRHPYTRGLLASSPQLYAAIKKLPVIPGNVLSLEDEVKGCRFHPRCALASDHCRRAEPPLYTLGDGQQVRCWLYASEAEEAGVHAG